ncbi:phage repressor protein CI [Pantoea sp. FDAARGOS_194]|uniref:phage repressor protein CI n=1 Tax=Pantoea TaxID=53335 RepID=UPI000BB56E98|nr:MULTISPECIES: phage repressor protein CI [Pantoea]PNK65203.1 phage repressor protein CI [Pantoea sp. FDAARGOS_194]
MSDEQGGSWKVDANNGALDRIMSSYGVKMQKDLADVLGIAKHSVSGWVQRDAIPGGIIVRCCLETGADINWLVTGDLANASLRSVEPELKGKALYDEIMANGGKHVLRRLLDAYGFTMQKQLGDLLDISSGTISTWIRREFFPGDVVVACALDTGVSLRWLATGKGDMFSSSENREPTSDIKRISKFKLESGKLIESGEWIADSSLTPVSAASLSFIEGISHSWLVNKSSDGIGNGRWVINIDDSLDVFDVVRLPGGKLRLSNNAVSFECATVDVKPFGAVIFTLEKNT